MQFAISLNMERTSPEEDMLDVVKHHLDLLEMAERAGFHSVWSAEHHTIELTVAPNPFSLLIFWGQHSSTIRLGTAAVVAPYWHPIRVAGEAALTDVFTNGRLELVLPVVLFSTNSIGWPMVCRKPKVGLTCVRCCRW